MAPREPFSEIILANNYPMWRNNCTLLVCDRIYNLLNNDAKYLWVDGTVMILGKLHNVWNIIQTIVDKSSWDTPRKRPVSLNAWVFQCLILTFRPPPPLFNVVTRSNCQRSVLQHWKGEEGVLAIDKKDAFLKYGRTPIKSVCFAQMCQHFCPWL